MVCVWQQFPGMSNCTPMGALMLLLTDLVSRPMKRPTPIVEYTVG